MTVAIDGPAAAGKGTLARSLADALGLAYLDTGRLYRATGYSVLQAGGDPSDPAAAEQAARSLDTRVLADPALRSEAAGDAASRVAAIPAVRDALLAFQRQFARTPPDGAWGAVLDGRDIGSVVCPSAPVKLFVTASAETRAQRRFLELRDAGQDVIESRILQDMKARDARDSSRGIAPLVPAADAVVLDTSDLDRTEALAAAFALAGDRLRAAGSDVARASMSHTGAS
ncbi:(d)CMP kinase [Roseospira marina]|uniref:(d)CMP kinase n=1 Tax=Roseospira marina TaxID=140057 RepID=UPI0014788332|nr:(d)CMP kinase [Roseospira marina]